MVFDAAFKRAGALTLSTVHPERMIMISKQALHRTLAVTLCLALAAPVVAIAQAAPSGAGADMGHGMGHHDMDRDRTITRDEARDHANKLFDRLDVNHDGKLDAADRMAHESAMFDRIDTNHDGSISREEFIAAHDHMGGPGDMEGRDHEEMDHDMDHDRGPDQGGLGHGGMDHGGMDHRMDRMEMVGAILHNADPAHTGTVTRDAFVASALDLFDKADTNHDGQLTPDEIRAGRMAMRAHWREAMQHHHDDDMPPPVGH